VEINTNNKNEKAFNQVLKKIERFLNNRSDYSRLSFSETVNTLCIDSPWGNGKSFFADFLSSGKNEISNNFNLVKINAFEYDVFSDPVTRQI